MASCEVQGTPSSENLEEGTAQAEAKTINKFETVNIRNGIVPQPTKIPAPVRLVTSNTSINNSTRKYTTLLKLMDTENPQNESFSSTSTLVNTIEDSQTCIDARSRIEESFTGDSCLIDLEEDSGLQIDCSATDEELQLMEPTPTCSTPREQLSLDNLANSASFLKLEAAEQQTLRVLQQAVAEMEADVELHNKILEEELKLEQEQQRQKLIEQQMQQEIKQQIQQKQIEPHILQSIAGNADQDKVEINQLQLDTMEEPITSSLRKRKHVRVEQLLEAEHNIEMLQKLLQTDNQLASGDTITHPQGIDEFSVFELSAGNAMLDIEREHSKKQNGLLYSMLHIFCGNSIRKLSYPLLLCGMAVGLIYYFRKE